MNLTKLARIKPAAPRLVHMIAFPGETKTFRKDRGWYKVTPDEAAVLAAEKVSDQNPEASPFLFDVKDAEEAKLTVAAEQTKTDPAGTPDKPLVPETLPVRGRRSQAANADK